MSRTETIRVRKMRTLSPDATRTRDARQHSRQRRQARRFKGQYR